MDAFFEWFRWLYDTTGINLTIFYDAFDRERFVGGFFTTIRLALSCILLSVVIGVLGAWLQGSRLKLTRHVVYWYIQFFRNTPPLVQLHFFYFGVGACLKTTGGTPLVSNVTWAILGLSMYAGAFNVEIFRSGIESVPRRQEHPDPASRGDSACPKGLRIAILDADFNGPSQARMAGVQGALFVAGSHKVALPRTSNGIAVFSMGSLIPESEALEFESAAEGESHTWRATREFALLGEILASFEWGALDLLMFDLPPGAERTVQYADFLGARTSFLLVTIPSEVARGVVARSVAALRRDPIASSGTSRI